MSTVTVAPSSPPGSKPTPIEVYARAKLPSRFGEFEIVAFCRGEKEIEHVALVRGDVLARSDVLVRLHSECLTGDVLGSLRCDCRDQLEMAVQDLGVAERGILLYLRQEGRGIGLANKIRAYALQDRGLDTFEANRHLGFDDDLREYGDAAEILRCLGVASIVLLTNNPKKIDGLRQHGVTVVGRRPLESIPTIHNHRYLLAKKTKKGHLFGDALIDVLAPRS
jgi:GTP cyclohydrolase II